MVNESFAALAGLSTDSALGMSLDQFLPEETTRPMFAGGPNQSAECDCSKIRVKLIMRVINFSGKPRNVIAIQDIRMRRQAEEHVRYLADYDAITGIPNRDSFSKRLDQEIELASAARRHLAACLRQRLPPLRQSVTA